jgi:hypothetical protein
MRIKGLSALAVGLFLSLPISAGTITQVVPLSVSASGSDAFSGNVGSFFIANNLQPFDSTLGTLTSFDFTWLMHFTGSATTDSNGFEFILGRVNGGYFIGSSLYDGNGGSGGAGSGDPNTFINFSFDVNSDTLFQVADSGVTYNHFILDLVTGTDPYTADWAAYSFQAPAIPWNAGADGSLTVAYNYTSTPEPSTFLLLSPVLLGVALLRRRLT